ncbi:Immunoglobulin I-set domain-containing protein [Nonomuraea solani]|uniref:Immunoglobulin I-set domain-containing protein n=1 Tax=Nonomuraea solani TaxID=1144553 RepID=A0A1H6BSQ4_9ACTN|nr:HtaA domain-containing protein [Nonomuraea solani]SEG63680.1 Immunoglobulin I-set domain-containing protein [Nonomuraea solani]
MRVLRGAIASILAAAALLTAAPSARADTVAITVGTLDWGVKESFRTYITGSIAHGTITTGGGAADNGDGTFRFPLAKGTYDTEQRTVLLSYTGQVRFTGHSGALDLLIANPQVAIGATGSTLYADVTSLPLDGTKPVSYPVVDLATLTLNTPDGSTWTDLPAALTAAGVPAFADFYGEGEALDPVTVTYDGPGGTPAPGSQAPVPEGGGDPGEPGEEWTPPGTVKHTSEALSPGLAGITSVDVDQRRNRVYAAGAGKVTAVPGGTSTDIPGAQHVRVDSATGDVYVLTGRTYGQEGDQSTVTLWRDGVELLALNATYAQALALDLERDRIYVIHFEAGANLGDARLSLLTRDGDAWKVAATVSRPYASSVAVAPDGTPYTGAGTKPGVVRHDPATLAGATVVEDAHQLLAFAPDGTLYAGSLFGNVTKITPSGVETFRTVLYQTSLAVNPRTGDLYASRALGSDVLVYRDGKLVEEGIPGGVARYGIAIGPDDKVYVPDNTQDRLAVLTRNQSPTIGQNPRSVTAARGEQVTFTASATGAPEPAVTWQARPSGGEWADVPGANTTTLTVRAEQDRTQYRAIFTNPAGRIATAAALLALEGGAAASQTVSAQVVAGHLTLSVAGTAATLTAANAGQSATGSLNTATVTDQRGTVAGWSLVGQVTDFTSAAGGAIAASALGWRPSTDGAAAPGPGAALGQATTLCSAATGTGTGVSACAADLTLNVPAGTRPGAYTATLTLTLS